MCSSIKFTKIKQSKQMMMNDLDIRCNGRKSLPLAIFKIAIIIHLSSLASATDEQLNSAVNDVQQDYNRELKLEEFGQRNARVKAVCAKHGEALLFNNAISEVLKYQMRWLPHRDLSVCLTSKVGSTTLKKMMWEDLVSYNKEKNSSFVRSSDIQIHLPDKSQLTGPLYRNMVKTFQNMTSVMAVRHPFIRLASAYLDKVKECEVPHTICLMKWTSDKESFPKFIKDKVLRTVPTGQDVNIWSSNHRTNNHWRPYIGACTPCDIDYKYIFKKETFADDLQFLSKEFGLAVEEIAHHNKKATEKFVYDLYKTLDLPTVMRLAEAYKFDMELFDYSADEYVALFD